MEPKPKVVATDRWTAVSLLALGIAAGVLGLNGLWSSFSSIAPDETALLWHTGVLLPACALLLAKRRYPLVVLVGSTTLFLLDLLLLGGSIGMLLVFIEALYSAALLSTARANRVLLRLIVGGTAVALAAIWIGTTSLSLAVFVVLQLFAVIGTPYWAATAVRHKSELADLAEQRTADVLRFAALREAQLVREERGRMARDLHDVIAGDLSAIAIHAEAALSRDDDPARSRDALAQIRVASMRGLEEMRSMIVLLRSGQESPVTVGSLGRAADLVANVRKVGLDVRFDEAALDILPALSPLTDLAASRILQEALTNATKHAPDGTTRVSIAADDSVLVLEVQSIGAGVPAPTTKGAHPSEHAGTGSGAVVGSGLGLLTMTERADAVGGSLDAGWSNRSTGEWTVRAELPLGAPA
ncbi:signal transduction histidine kinase [Glaciihabitans tibetensis]|uniref:histidine kinase n=1 Tax=Glaciihabitans tibetensis TaxID=1266600 RepID=A0A2T0V6U5_9MICO|nr:histidine kinase [Glaciihabitans tibetensis]PRY65896.1 signal transduction histidine kinase [Glaciihabitans tibetensis]